MKPEKDSNFCTGFDNPGFILVFRVFLLVVFTLFSSPILCLACFLMHFVLLIFSMMICCFNMFVDHLSLFSSILRNLVITTLELCYSWFVKLDFQVNKG